jgi:GTP-binding protein LepA
MLIRNFSIIAHIDHGKTTLTDRLLLKTQTITERQFSERLLDSNPIEQERGITIKMAPVRMSYTLPPELAKKYGETEAMLALIDTPGHVDFSYEVSRSLAAVEGVVLLVDATQGIQAQTLSHFYTAREHGLAIIPALNKVDMNNAEVDTVTLELMDTFGFEPEEVVQVSAKTGLGVDHLFEAILERIPGPQQDIEKPFRALIFTSLFHPHKGVVAAIRVREGEVRVNDKLTMLGTGTDFQPAEIGIYSPTMKPIAKLSAGEVGYIATGLKEIGQAQVGDTIAPQGIEIAQLPGYNPPQLMVFMDFYPIDGDDYSKLIDGVEKLKMHDASLAYSATHSIALGNGLRMGFLGVLHADIVRERLSREYGLDLITTVPTVRYEVMLSDATTMIVKNAAELPDPTRIKETREPMALVHLYTPKETLGGVMTLCEDHRGKLITMEYIAGRSKLTYKLPLAEIIVTFFDDLKSISSGYASIDYTLVGYEPAEVVKLSILINKEPVEAFSQIIVKEKALQVAKSMVAKLKEVIPRQLFPIPIQATVGGNILARETVSAFRKDVTAKLYGGDVTRKLKLLDKQKKGKERRAMFGKVDIPQEAFMEVLKKG